MTEVTDNAGQVLTDDTPELSAQAVQERAGLSQKAKTLLAEEGKTREVRARLYRSFSEFVLEHGEASVEKKAKADKFSGSSSALPYSIHAQWLLDINIFKKGLSRDKKRELTTRVRPFALMIEALVAFDDWHDMTDEEYLVWWQKQGGKDGLEKRLKASKPTSTTATDDSKKVSADERIEAALASPGARIIEADLGLSGLVPGKPALFMVRQDENGKAVILPLPNASTADLADIADYRGEGLDGAAAPLIFWHQLIATGQNIVPDEKSDQPVTEVDEDDELNDTHSMLPANAMFMVRDGMFSVASARKNDTFVVEVTPREGVDLGIGLTGDRFMNNRTRHKVGEALIKPPICGGFGISTTGDDEINRVKFKHKTDKSHDGQLSFPKRSEMGKVWTMRRSASFVPKGEAAMDDQQFAAFRDEFFKMLSGKKKDEHVTVSVAGKGIAFKRGNAKTATYAADCDGEASVRVTQSDLLHVVRHMMSLPWDGPITWALDPNGLLSVEVSTAVAQFSVFIQTLEDRGDDTIKSRALLERVNAALKLVPPIQTEAGEPEAAAA